MRYSIFKVSLNSFYHPYFVLRNFKHIQSREAIQKTKLITFMKNVCTTKIIHQYVQLLQV